MKKHEVTKQQAEKQAGQQLETPHTSFNFGPGTEHSGIDVRKNDELIGSLPANSFDVPAGTTVDISKKDGVKTVKVTFKGIFVGNAAVAGGEVRGTNSSTNPSAFYPPQGNFSSQRSQSTTNRKPGFVAIRGGEIVHDSSEVPAEFNAGGVSFRGDVKLSGGSQIIISDTDITLSNNQAKRSGRSK